MRATPFIHLVTGEPPRPNGSPLRASDVPDDLLLRSASAPQRERLLVGLALSLEEKPALKDVLRRVASEELRYDVVQNVRAASRAPVVDGARRG